MVFKSTKSIIETTSVVKSTKGSFHDVLLSSSFTKTNCE